MILTNSRRKYFKSIYLTIIPRTRVGYGLLDTESAIINSYPTSVSGIIVLLNIKHLTLFMLRFSVSIHVNIVIVYNYRLFQKLSFVVIFHIWTNYKILDLYREWRANQIARNSIFSVCYITKVFVSTCLHPSLYLFYCTCMSVYKF